MTCSGCGLEAPADFAFCPKCGARLAAPAPPPPPSQPRAPEGDRRPVTVLFADLAGFTALSEGLDPEEVRGIQADLFREMSASIERYDGFVEKFVGDAVMAVFGAPRAHEDDPERGLHAALLMRERMGAVNRRWERRVGHPLALHIGLHTGPVVAGRIGGAADAAYAVTGDTVNTASRLQSAAPAGEIFVSDSTYQLTHQTVTMGQLQTLKINPTGELPEPMNPFAAMETLNKRDGFELNEADLQILAAHGTQMTGHFLIDQQGIIRWSHVEAIERMEDLSRFPSEEEILRAARSL